MSNILHRTFPLREAKLAENTADAMTFSGYGSVFGNRDWYDDIIEPGAFADSLAAAKAGGEWPAMLLQHGAWGMGSEDMTPIGVWSDLSEDDHGLKVTGQLADTQRGVDTYKLLRMKPRPAIDGLSIGFIAKDWEPRSHADEPRRRIKKADLIEVSLVTFPANEQARVVDVKSIDKLTGLAEIETYLRDAGGFTRREAKALISRIKAADQRDAGDGMVSLAGSITRNINMLRNTPHV